MISKILLFTVALIFIACGGKDDKKKETGGSQDTDITKNPVYQKGVELIGKSDCLTCHKVEVGINGPSYRDVANKYANAGDTIVPYLADKIIKGGSGTWGQVMMTPHPAVSQEDAEAMVKYILLLKN